MSTFVEVNKLYVNSFGLKPPVRVCVQCLPSDSSRLSMSALCLSDDLLEKRKNLHVQSFSRWAPANVGPYSQANLVGTPKCQFLLMAGQIGLHPSLMQLHTSTEVQFG